ncbi:MAG: hypothetical protein S4CHLAM20_15570 [Chlamydiia bacterium]|nr:hypothetical protein [Chlamydiia bacterium]
MILLKSLVLSLVALSLYAATEGGVDIYVSTPNSEFYQDEDIRIGSYFTPNNQSYPLTPDEIKKIATEKPIFSSQEAFAILHKNSSLFGNVPRGKLLTLNFTIPESNSKKDIQISFSEKNSKTFVLLPLSDKDKSIPIEVYLIDTSKPAQFQKVIQVKFDEKYPIERLEGKSLFVIIPMKKRVSGDTVNFNHYTLPMEVNYHAP